MHFISGIYQLQPVNQCTHTYPALALVKVGFSDNLFCVKHFFKVMMSVNFMSSGSLCT